LARGENPQYRRGRDIAFHVARCGSRTGGMGRGGEGRELVVMKKGEKKRKQKELRLLGRAQ
jgi:hypothetical protein